MAGSGVEVLERWVSTDGGSGGCQRVSTEAERLRVERQRVFGWMAPHSFVGLSDWAQDLCPGQGQVCQPLPPALTCRSSSHS